MRKKLLGNNADGDEVFLVDGKYFVFSDKKGRFYEVTGNKTRIIERSEHTMYHRIGGRKTLRIRTVPKFVPYTASGWRSDWERQTILVKRGK